MKRINKISRSSKKLEPPIIKNNKAAEKSVGSLLVDTRNTFSDCADLKQYSLKSKQIHFLYFEHLIDTEAFEREVLNPFEEVLDKEEEVTSYLENEQFQKVQTSEKIVEKITEGTVAIFHKDHQAFVINLYGPETRSIEKSETESTILGNHDAFIESKAVNISLVRRRLKTPKLKLIKLYVGEISRSDIVLMYIEGLVDTELLNSLKEKINNVELDVVIDTQMFVQMIDDYPFSIFPMYLTTERPDIVVSSLCKGKIAGFVDNSPAAFLSPNNFFDFFHSPDDWSQRWVLGSVTRLLRLVAFIITLTFTAFYVSTTTFHYEMIPETMLMSIAESRNKVPFSPLLEAMIMEVTIELLREAGVRLPTKIGQTIGIVGGIVIGQSAVQAGIVSNVLIIVVAISAIASFVMPSYLLSAAMRMARFGLIILSGILGNFGLLVGLTILLIHLTTLSNVSTPYFNPVAPFHPKELLASILRAPYWKYSSRPIQTHTKNKRDIKSIGSRTNE